MAFVLILGACKSSGSMTSGASAYANYSEDLSTALPVYPNYKERLAALESKEPSSSPQSLDSKLAQLAVYQFEKNKTQPYFNGYKVLVYSGLDRELAFKTQEDLNELYPDFQAEIQYQQPRYLVKVGRYAYKVEALKSFNQIKTEFPSARIIQDRIQRKEFTAPTIDEHVERQN